MSPSPEIGLAGWYQQSHQQGQLTEGFFKAPLGKGLHKRAPRQSALRARF
jgi:hypothetical protein